MGAQLVYFGYYGDADTFDSIRLQPFLSRPEFATRRSRLDDPTSRAVMDPCRGVDPGHDRRADVVIVGSGAAGAILAYEMAGAGKQ